MLLRSIQARARGRYAGIGARATPADVLELMSGLASKLANEKLDDQAFFDGAISVPGCPEVYLPWPQYNDHSEFRLSRPTQQAYALTAKHHPAWVSCSSAAQAVHARNCHQVLGDLPDDPVSFVLCYTPDGSLTSASRAAGGTGQALRVARSAGVPVFNLQRPEHRERLEVWVAA